MIEEASCCPRFQRAMAVLGKRWTCQVVKALLDRPRRFSEISGYVGGLSDRLLSDRLKELEQAGIVDRKVYDRRPVWVEYALTDKGMGLRAVVDAVQIWADEWETTGARIRLPGVAS